MRILLSTRLWTKIFLFISSTFLMFSMIHLNNIYQHDSSNKNRSVEHTKIIKKNDIHHHHHQQQPKQQPKEPNHPKNVQNDKPKVITSEEQINDRKRMMVSDFGTNFDRFDESQLCTGSDARKCVAPLKRHHTNLYIAPKYNFSACMIYKNMSSMLRALMCYLFDPDLSDRLKPKFTDYYKGNKCLNDTMSNFLSYKKLKDAYPKFDVKSWSMLMLIRDPIERFVSGFVDKCVRTKNCKPCNDDLECFIKSRYKEVMKNSKAKIVKNNYLNQHFFPQNWQCQVVDFYHNYIYLKYSSNPDRIPSFYQELADILRNNNVEENIVNSVLDHLENEKSPNTASEKLFLGTLTQKYTQQISESPKLMEYIIRMFYHDYRLFNFTMPSLKTIYRENHT